MGCSTKGREMAYRLRDLLRVLGDSDSAGWTIRVNGEVVNAREVELESKFGLLRWGKTAVGYDSWGFEEPGGGGTVLVPFVKSGTGDLLIGVVEQMRPFQSEKLILNLPRGFLEIGLNHFESAVTELHEEFAVVSGERVFLQPGDSGNPNSTFFVTLGEEKGVKYYGVQFYESEIEQINGIHVLSRKVVSPQTPAAEKIIGSQFVPWQVAATVGDLFTNSGTVRLMAKIVKRLEF